MNTISYDPRIVLTVRQFNLSCGDFIHATAMTCGMSGGVSADRNSSLFLCNSPPPPPSPLPPSPPPSPPPPSPVNPFDFPPPPPPPSPLLISMPYVTAVIIVTSRAAIDCTLLISALSAAVLTPMGANATTASPACTVIPGVGMTRSVQVQVPSAQLLLQALQDDGHMATLLAAAKILCGSKSTVTLLSSGASWITPMPLLSKGLGGWVLLFR